MPHKPPLSPLSAALTLVEWHDQHGRWPHAEECTPANGLPSRFTLYRLYTSYPVAVHVASAVALLWAQGEQDAASAVVASVALVRPPQPEYRPCLRCGKLIVFERVKPIRHCGDCRYWLTHEVEADDEAEAPVSMQEAVAVLRRWEALG